MANAIYTRAPHAQLDKTTAGWTRCGTDKNIPGRSRMIEFSAGLFLISAATLMYEVILTRLLSVMCWYYLAFVSISMGMLGMTAGALVVQLRPHLFTAQRIPERLRWSALAAAISLPIALLTIQSIPLENAVRPQMVYSFLLFSAVIAVPFFFSGVAICLALTRTNFPIGKIYFVDLIGAAAGSIGAIVLLELMDPSSAGFAISAVAFISAAAWARYAGEAPQSSRYAIIGAAIAAFAILNAALPAGFRPIFSKGAFENRQNLIAEVWNPISRIRALDLGERVPFSWGNSPNAPQTKVGEIGLDIDGEAATPVYRHRGGTEELSFLGYDVTSMAARLRAGGTAAIIGVGGGRDVLTAYLFGFKRIVGIELNPGIEDLVMRQFAGFGNLSGVPGLEYHLDEGRSYLSRTDEKFDVIQASMVDTWAATAAGAMTLSENALYTVEAWRIFYQHLKPGGLITFTRFYMPEPGQTPRLFSLGWATLLLEGVANPGAQIAMIASAKSSTILVSNAPFSDSDLNRIRSDAKSLGYKILYLPGEGAHDPDLAGIADAHSMNELLTAGSGDQDFSPVFDSSPFFFNTLRLGGSGLRGLASAIASGQWGTGNQRALLFLLIFLIAILILIALAIGIPLTRWAELPARPDYTLATGLGYFVAIGLGFMLAEMAMIQQLSIFLGYPIYSLVVTLAGLILATGLGSLASEQLELRTDVIARAPAIASAAILIAYCIAVIPVIHALAYLPFWMRAITCLGLIVPCGLIFGFCFPVGLRWMRLLGQEDSLPWMWALNGAASVVASLIAVLISIEASITATVITAAACYLLAGMALPRNESETAKS